MLTDGTLFFTTKQKGFAEDAFSPFYSIMHRKRSLQPFEYFAPLTNTVFAKSSSIDKGSGGMRYHVIDLPIAETGEGVRRGCAGRARRGGSRRGCSARAPAGT